MEQILLAQEKAFFQLRYTSDETWLAAVLHDDFLECGKSGCLYGKEETMRALLALTEDRNITIYNFTCAAVDSHCWLVHYMTCGGAAPDDGLYYRTSVWCRDWCRNWRQEGETFLTGRRDGGDPAGLKLRFHQASLLNDGMVQGLALTAW